MTVRELVTRLGFKIDDGTLKEYERKVESAKKKSADLSNAVGGIGKAVWLIGGAVAAAGVAALGKSILDTTGEVEQYRVTLGTMIGDQEKANRIIHDLDYSPVSDFYGTASAIGGLQGMVTFGMQAEEASATLTRLGDIAQGNGEAFRSLSLNMGQVFAKGKADAIDLKQFVGQGFDVVGEVSKMTGRSRAEIEKAGVSYEQCAQALVHITSAGGKYEGMLAKQSRTLPGLVKQFQSLGAAIRESIGTAVLDHVKDLMQHFLSLGRAMQGNIVAVGTKVFDTFLRGIANAVIFFDVLQLRMEAFGGAFTPIKAIIKDVFSFFGSVIKSSVPLLMALAQAVLLAFKPIQAFVRPVLAALKPLFEDVFGFAADTTMGLAGVIESLTPVMSVLGHIIGAVINVMTTGLSVIFPILKPLVGIILGIVAALKVWAAVQAVLNVIMTANPIGLIILAVVALIGMITMLVRKWEAVKTALVKGAKAVFEFFKKYGLAILAVIAPIPAFIIGAIMLLVKNWDKVKAALIKGIKTVGDFFRKVGLAIKNAFLSAWSSVKQAAQKALDGIKSAWGAVAGFFSSLWNGIVAVAEVVWDGIVGVFRAVVARIQAVWNGIKDFFKGLWDALKESPLEAVQFIKDTFPGLFDSIKRQFFGFIDVIKDGWDKVKGFFGGLWNGAVNFFTGGEPDAPQPTKVNDLILTPDDTIFAMKNPASLMDRLAGLLAQAAPQPSYALAGSAASQAVRQSVSNDYSRHSSSQVYNTPVSVTVHASGMTAEQARRAVEVGVRGALHDAIAGSRGTIPSPEARRA